MSNNLVGNIYRQIIDEVIDSSRVDFEEGGVEEGVLEDLRKVRSVSSCLSRIAHCVAINRSSPRSFRIVCSSHPKRCAPFELVSFSCSGDALPIFLCCLGSLVGPTLPGVGRRSESERRLALVF